MRTTLGQDVAGIAAGLDDHVIHVWLLDYRQSLRRAPLCALLGTYLGVPGDQVVLAEDAHGRPALAPPWEGRLQFNWSHSGDQAVIAVARQLVPGIDLERFRARPKALAIAERFFHPAEVAALQALDEVRREHAFTQLWTGKEAVLKALGRGIAFGLHRLQLSVGYQPPVLLWLDGDDATQWQLHPLDVGAHGVASLAWRGPARAVDIRTLAAGS